MLWKPHTQVAVLHCTRSDDAVLPTSLPNYKIRYSTARQWRSS